jgi:DNA-binding transcriptional MocR family regulator
MKRDQFRVINLDKRVYLKPDEYLNGWAKHCGWKATLVFDSLCRHADRNRESFPSVKLMAKEHGVCEKTIEKGIQALAEWHIISKEQKRNRGGKFLHNTYYILAKEHWKRKPEYHRTPLETDGYRTPLESSTVPPEIPTKGTHKKGTHITTAVVDKNVDNFVSKVLRWAYEKNQHTPSCPKEAYRRLVRAAVDRVGLERVRDKFMGHDNAILFLVDLKQL